MKKRISLFLVVLVLIPLLSACTNTSILPTAPTTLPDWMSGIDAAKLLLADQRLDPQFLETEGDIFENGVEVMNSLAQKAKDNLNVPYAAPSLTPLSLTSGSREVLSSPTTQGKLERDDANFYWSDFVEYNNTYSYFENLTGNIIINAQVAADLIDNIKKNVRVVDKWVVIDERVRYFLHVEENSELLIEHYTGEGLDLLNICMRYKNAEGKDVYELYRRSTTEQYAERATYIPGERYEISMHHQRKEAEGIDCFVADHSKGYWETCILGIAERRANVSYFIMKDNLCYDAFYDAESKQVPSIKVMSADRAADMFSVSSDDRLHLTLKFSGFDGIKEVSAKISDTEYNSQGGYANIPHGEVATVHFENGKTAKYGDKFVGGMVEIGSIHVMSYAGDVYAGEMFLVISGDTQEKQFEAFRSFLDETGMTCRRDLDAVIAGIHAAYQDLDSIIDYYKWNDILITDNAGINEATDREYQRFDKMLSYYTDVRNVEAIDINDTERIEMNIQFSPITEGSFVGAKAEGVQILLEGASLTVEDTLLYVENEPYQIMFALANATGGLVHFQMDNSSTTTYTGEDRFTVTASALEFTLPTLAPGDYTLVAYIATADGIRSSAYTPVALDEILNTPLSFENISISASKGDNGALVLTYSTVTDFTLDLTTDGTVDYAEFKTTLSEMAFRYGTPADTIEMLTDDTYTPLTGSEVEIAEGTYRIAYAVENGEHSLQGYIYVRYSLQQ